MPRALAVRRGAVALVAGAASVCILGLTGCAGIPPVPPQVAAADMSSPTVGSDDASSDLSDGAAGSAANADPDPDLTADRTSDPDVLAQLDYVLAYWSEYNDEEWGVLEGNDCVNFASQSLVARGWAEGADWYHHGDPYESSPSWRSSTAFRTWLAGHPELATELDDDERDEVRLGDIVQFDWDDSGDRDHTGVVTRIERGDDGEVRIAFAGHTKDSAYRDVDRAITVEHPGADVHYWRLAD
ncbi:amidase domain-containing protein [Agromyces sp. SYSU T0242]|uniref:amidase domain-containing protein n=1 Tax=Agromyces litoreus TaxID=3158561 RepID=UPI003394001B